VQSATSAVKMTQLLKDSNEKASLAVSWILVITWQGLAHLEVRPLGGFAMLAH